MAYRNADLNKLFQQYRGRDATAAEWQMYGNAPKDKLLGDLQGSGWEAYKYGQSQQEYADRVAAYQQQLASSTSSPEAQAEMRALADQEYGAYYQRLQQQRQQDFDYVLGQINTGRVRNQQDLKTIIDQIAAKELATEKELGLRREGLTAEKTAFEKVAPQQMRNLQQGFSNRGLLYSGERDTGQENLTFQQQQQRDAYARQDQAQRLAEQQARYEYGQQRQQARTSAARYVEDAATREGRTRTEYDRSGADLDRQRTYDVQSYVERERERRERDIYNQQLAGYSS